jgi:hypothetical protein
MLAAKSFRFWRVVAAIQNVADAFENCGAVSRVDAIANLNW